ncbi:MAG: MFS transporter [Promethearchaeota archaeon]
MADESSSSKEAWCEVPTEHCVIGTFGAASFMNDMGSDIVFSIWPTFVLLLGGNALLIGILDGLGDFIVNLSKGFSGFLSDKIQRRKPFIWSGYLAGSMSRILYGITPSWHWLVPARVLDRAGKIRGAPRDAIVADISSTETRGRNFGILRTLDNAGAVLGIFITIAFVTFAFPLLEFQGFTLLGSLQLLFLVAAVPTLIGAILIIVKIPDYRKQIGKPVFRVGGISHNLALFIVLSFIFSLAFFSYSFVTLYASLFLEVPILNPYLKVTIAYLIFTLAAALLSAPFGRLSDRIGRRAILFLGYCVFALMCLVFIMVPNDLTMLAAMILYGASIGAIVPTQKSFVAELAPVDLRASLLGLYQMLIGLAALAANILAGIIWVLYFPAASFFLALVLTIIAALLLPLVKESQPSS